MHVGVVELVVVAQGIDHRAGFLARGRIVQINEGITLHRLLKDGELGADVRPMNHSDVEVKELLDAGTRAGQRGSKRTMDGGSGGLKIMRIDDPAQPDYNQKPRLER
jgi:hypothetical protein